MSRTKLSKKEITKRTRAGAYHDGTKPLTPKKVAKLKVEGRYHDALVSGLYLQVTKRKSDNGAKSAKAKSWVLRYELHGRERMMGLGSAAIFNLKQARERAKAARQLITDGTDPLAMRHATKAAAKAAAASVLTFREAAQRYFDQHQAEWTNASHRDQFLSSLKKHATVLLNMDVAAIGLPDVLRAIEPIWITKSVTADRVRNRIESVLDWAVVRGHRAAGTNPARWRGHLDQVLPAVRKVAPVKHHPALDYKLLPAFMARLRDCEGIAARGLEFMILTAARSGEVTGAVWDDEIDLDNAMWTIPAERMGKTKREHRVPLSPAAIDLLRKLPHEDGNPFVFIGPKAGHGLSRMAFTRVMQRLGRDDVTIDDASIHGFRSCFSDWANEETRHSNHTIEISLSHKVGTAVERAYRRGHMFNKRVALMADWARFCIPSANVVSINAAREAK